MTMKVNNTFTHGMFDIQNGFTTVYCAIPSGWKETLSC